MNDDTYVGEPAEWDLFLKAFPGIDAEYKPLIDLANRVFNRRCKTKHRVDFAIYSLGGICLEEFNDIFILAANGHGFGAQKILRALYERIVTTTYLHEHPDEYDAFRDFEDIRIYKMYREMAQVLPDDDFTEKLAELKAARDAVRERFRRKCSFAKGCENMLDAISWSPLSIAAMAQKAGASLREDLLVAYYTPMTETHPTDLSVVARLSIDAENRLTFSKQAEKARAAGYRAFAMACRYSLMAISLQLKRFDELAELVPEFDARVAAMQAIIDAHLPED